MNTTKLLIARHGDAGYKHPSGTLSDAGGWLTDLGKDQISKLATIQATSGITKIFASPLSRAQESAQLFAVVNQLPVITIPGLAEYQVGELAGRSFSDPKHQQIINAWRAGELDAKIPGAETGLEIVTRFGAGLAEIVAQSQGETVLIFSHGGVMSLALPLLAANGAGLAAKPFLPNAVPATVLAIAELLTITSWPGTADQQVV